MISLKLVPPHDPAIRKLGARLQALRAARGWTMGGLATQCGVSRSSLSKIERDEVSPTYDVIQRIARGFDIPVAELFSQAAAGPALGRRAVGRADQTETHQGRGYLYQLLNNPICRPRKCFLPCLVDARTLQEAAATSTTRVRSSRSPIRHRPVLHRALRQWCLRRGILNSSRQPDGLGVSPSDSPAKVLIATDDLQS